jgi:hypothetical protein
LGWEWRAPKPRKSTISLGDVPAVIYRLKQKETMSARSPSFR